ASDGVRIPRDGQGLVDCSVRASGGDRRARLVDVHADPRSAPDPGQQRGIASDRGGGGGEDARAVVVLPDRDALEEAFVPVGHAVTTADRLQQLVTRRGKRDALPGQRIAETLPQASLTLPAHNVAAPAATSAERAGAAGGPSDAGTAAAAATATIVRLQRAGAARSDDHEKDRSHCCDFSASAWKWARRLPMTSSRSPSRTPGRLWRVRPMRWSVRRSCGKLYVRIFSERSPDPISFLRASDSCFCSSSILIASKRARNTPRALSLFLICDFSSWQVTTIPVGK